MLKLSAIVILILIASCHIPLKTAEISSDDDIRIGHVSGCWLPDYTPAEESKYVLPYPIGHL